MIKNLETGVTVPFHTGQNLAYDSSTRTVAYIAGSQSGKTSFGPYWLKREIDFRGGGDYIVTTSTYDLFKLKLLPTMLDVFEGIYGIGRYWTGDRVIELCDPESGNFLANKSQDMMWGRIILRSADALSGLESATGKAAWLDEAGMEKFSLKAYKAVRRRLALNRGRILITTTLYDLGWVTNLILDPTVMNGKSHVVYENGGEIEYTVDETGGISMVQLDSIVNPSFSVEEFEEARALYDDAEFEMFYRGRKGSRKFLIYSDFNPQMHVCAPFRFPSSWKRFVGVDFGGVHMACVFYAEDPVTKKLYCYREYMGGNIPIGDHVREIMYGEYGLPNLCYGGAGSEDQWRTEFSRNGFPILPPTVKDVEIGIARVIACHKTDSIIYFNNIKGLLDEKGRYRRKKNIDGTASDEIDGKSSFHRIDSERYILSSISGMIIKAKVIRLMD